MIKSNCPFCRKTLMPVEEVNMKLPYKKRIDNVDCYEWEFFRMKTIPIIDKLDFDGYPTLFLDGIKITNVLTKNQLRAFLDGFTKQDKIIVEQNKWEH